MTLAGQKNPTTSTKGLGIEYMLASVVSEELTTSPQAALHLDSKRPPKNVTGQLRKMAPSTL